MSCVALNKVRYHPDQLDIHNAAGILASQFDNNYLNIPVSHGPPQLLEPSLDLHSNNHHHHSSYPQDYPIPSRNQLGLDISAQPYPNARLPPPPSQGPSININYQPAPLHRRYSNDVARDQSYSSSGPLSPPISADIDHRSTTQRRDSTSQPAPQQSVSGSEDPPPRREGANLVIACRQWYVLSVARFSVCHLPAFEVARGRSVVILQDRSAIIVSADQMSANTTPFQNVGGPISVRVLVNVPARSVQLTDPLHHCHPQKGRELQVALRIAKTVHKIAEALSLPL
jgi:hypothetical protein